MPARYEGHPQVEFLADGRNVRLIANLTFFDPNETRWAVPAGAVVDGASIPALFWPIVGGPFEGNYRDASIIHDWYCDKRTRTWQATHRVFYDAMLVSGVSNNKARLMYFAVRWRGPRWEERVSINTNLASDAQFNFVASPIARTSLLKVTTEAVPSPGEGFDIGTQLNILSDIKTKMDQNELSADEIDDLADNARPQS